VEPRSAAPRRRVLITGCGRSGTRYTVALLDKHGLDVRHEEIGRDGAVSWCMAVDSERTPWGPPRREYQFEHIFQQVRSPLKAIPSMLAMNERSWRYICEWIPCVLDEAPILRAAKYWYYWNLHAEKIAQWRYRIEDFRHVYPEFCDRLGIRANATALDSLATNINTRSYGRALHLYDEACLKLGVSPSRTIRALLSQRVSESKRAELTWSELEGLNAELALSIKIKAEQYGYVTGHG
jgi:hypothetical protein